MAGLDRRSHTHIQTRHAPSVVTAVHIRVAGAPREFTDDWGANRSVEAFGWFVAITSELVKEEKEDVASKPGFIKGTNPALKKSSNIPETYAKMFGSFH